MPSQSAGWARTSFIGNSRKTNADTVLPHFPGGGPENLCETSYRRALGVKLRTRIIPQTTAETVHSNDLATAMACNVKGAGGKNAVTTPSKSEAVIAPNTMRSPTKGDLHVIDAEMKMQNNGPMIRMRAYGDGGGGVILSHDSAALPKTGDTAADNKTSPTTTAAARLCSSPRSIEVFVRGTGESFHGADGVFGSARAGSYPDSSLMFSRCQSSAGRPVAEPPVLSASARGGAAFLWGYAGVRLRSRFPEAACRLQSCPCRRRVALRG